MNTLQEAAMDSIACINIGISDVFSKNDHPEKRFINQTLKNLFSYLDDRSTGVSLLVSYEFCWDAEIVLRSFYETAAKILYICFSQGDERIVLVKEYWSDFEEINDRRTAQKAEHAEKLFEELGRPTDIFAILQDEKIFKTNATKSKAMRRKIEQKWSFVEIINQLSALTKNGKPLNHITALLHIYGMASHLIHADKNAMDLMHDRAMRDHDEQKIVALSHLGRIMSDQVYITRFCYEALRHAMSDDQAISQNIIDSMKKFDAINKPIQAAFYESQREFYEKWRGNK